MVTIVIGLGFLPRANKRESQPPPPPPQFEEEKNQIINFGLHILSFEGVKELIFLRDFKLVD